MTLVLSVLTHDLALQVSDRRLVGLRKDGSVAWERDERNKAVVFGNRVAWAYTGLARVGPERQPTDMWLAETLHEAESQDGAVELLARRATERFQHPLIRQVPSSMRLHEFAGVGWARFAESGFTDFWPYLCVVTNMRSPDGTRLTQAAESFASTVIPLADGQPFALLPSGVRLHDDEIAALQAGVLAAYGDVDLLVGFLIAQMRAIAAHNPLIGRGLLVNCLPRSTIREGDAGVMVIAGGPLRDVQSFLYVSPDENDPRQLGPIFVMPHGAIISGFTAGPAGTTGMTTPE